MQAELTQKEFQKAAETGAFLKIVLKASWAKFEIVGVTRPAVPESSSGTFAAETDGHSHGGDTDGKLGSGNGEFVDAFAPRCSREAIAGPPHPGGCILSQSTCGDG